MLYYLVLAVIQTEVRPVHVIFLFFYFLHFFSGQYAQQPPMHQAPHFQQPVHIQAPPPQHAPPMQQSSIHIPVGPPSTKVSTATIVPTAYPTAPGNYSIPNPTHLYHKVFSEKHKNTPEDLLLSPKTSLK